MSSFIACKTATSIRNVMTRVTKQTISTSRGDSNFSEILKDGLEAEIKQIISSNPTLATHVTSAELSTIEEAVAHFATTITLTSQSYCEVENDPDFQNVTTIVVNILSAVSQKSVRQGIDFGTIVAVIIFILVCFFIFTLGGAKSLLRPHLFIAGVVLFSAIVSIRNL